MALGSLPPSRRRAVKPDETGLRDIIIDSIRYASDHAPRSLQRHIGPSQVGTPCDRQLAYRLNGTPESRSFVDPWPSIVGTAVHAWLADALEIQNQLLRDAGKPPRWHLERRVDVGLGLTGSCDCYDEVTGTVLDWKGQELSTPVATPNGWTTVGELNVGDKIFGADGYPTEVTRIYPTQQRDCYRITFEDGSSLVCDDVQEWEFIQLHNGTKITLSTKAAADALWRGRRRPQRNLAVSNASPLLLPDLELAVAPYTLGAWIGDGFSSNGAVCGADPEIFDNIVSDGYSLGMERTSDSGVMIRTVVGLTRQLQSLGLQIPYSGSKTGSNSRLTGYKRIPDQYLRASHTQRLELLRGLMDTDGSYNKIRNQAVFITKHAELADSVAELVSTLGWKPRIWKLNKTGFGKKVISYEVTFVPFGDNPFKLSRKANLVRTQGTTRARRRIVRSIEPTLSVSTRCIDVDASDHLYLVGRAMIPTHNCLGNTQHAKAVKEGPSEIYRIQAQCYGLGYARAGYEVNRVAVAFLARAKTLNDLYIWSEPFDPDTAIRALARMKRIQDRLDSGETPIDITPTPGDACYFCEFKRVNETQCDLCPEEPEV